MPGGDETTKVLVELAVLGNKMDNLAAGVNSIDKKVDASEADIKSLIKHEKANADTVHKALDTKIDKAVDAFGRALDLKVDKSRFHFIEKIVLGACALILVAVFGAWIAMAVLKPEPVRHTPAVQNVQVQQPVGKADPAH